MHYTHMHIYMYVYIYINIHSTYILYIFRQMERWWQHPAGTLSTLLMGQRSTACWLNYIGFFIITSYGSSWLSKCHQAHFDIKIIRLMWIGTLLKCKSPFLQALFLQCRHFPWRCCFILLLLRNVCLTPTISPWFLFWQARLFNNVKTLTMNIITY